MRTIYALLIGINQYKAIRNLKGAVNDVEAIKKYLEATYGDAAKIKTLCDGEARYQMTYDTFLDHLGQAEAGDTVFFHFSGHGSRENSPKVFHKEYTEEKNETLICHDSRTDGIYDLADKELAVLIEIVAKAGVHVVVSLDCCHSGSGTRDEGNIRQGKYDNRMRPLISYANGYYSEQLEKDDGIKIPEAPHIAFSACAPNQLAIESPQNHQGVFTTALLETLKEAPASSLSYGELFEKTRIAVQKNPTIQGSRLRHKPQVQAYGGASVWRTFLENQLKPNNSKFDLFFTKKQWKINAGVIHGLSILGRYTVEIFEEETLLGQGKTYVTHLDHAFIRNPRFSLDKNKTYQVKFKDFEPVCSVYKECTDAESNQIFTTTQVRFVEKWQDADYILAKSKQGKFNVIHLLTEKIIEQTNDLEELHSIFGKLIHWENLRQLKHKNSQLLAEDFKIEMEVYQNDVHQTVQIPDSGIISFDLLEEGGYYDTIPFEFHFTNNHLKKVHVAVVLLTPLYGIVSLKNVIVAADKQAMILEDQGGLGFSEGQDDDRTTTYIVKFIISHDRIETDLLNQDSFSQNKDLDEKNFDSFRSHFGNSSKGISPLRKSDWLIKDLTITLNLVGEKNINSKQSIQLNGLTILPHTQLKANVETTRSNRSVEGNYRSGNPPKSALFQNEHFELMEFGGNTRSGGAIQDIFQLTNITGTINETTPLVIQSAAFEDAEVVLPFAIGSDGLFYPIGYQTESNTVIIDQLPTEEEYRKGFRSPGRAIKFAFFKLTSPILKIHPNDYFQLRMIEQFDEKGNHQYEQLASKIQKAVANADNILLLIHGILGNTKGMGVFINELKADNPYDLILTFDYENLNTEIKVIARELENRLIGNKYAALGIEATNKIDILAHSMGGLVARYLIEKLNGQQYVNRLIICGTPNGGSVFGQLETLRQYALFSAALCVNFQMPFYNLIQSAKILTYLRANKLLMVTLEQMKKGSSFLQDLNQTNTPPSVPYFIVAGNVKVYQPKDIPLWKQFWEKGFQLFGNLINQDKPNDIAVMVEDIKIEASNIETYTVPCHHLNYFTEKSSQDKIIEILKR